MKMRILLIDESLTVQKVVALTLEKTHYNVQFAVNRKEAGKYIVENTPDLILVSDQVKDLNAGTFPKEVETWLGRNHDLPAMVLITSQDIREMRHYAGVLRKPFAPQVLKSVVDSHAKVFQNEATHGMHSIDTTLGTPASSLKPGAQDFEEERLEKAFHHRFNDEAELVSETMGSFPVSQPADVLNLEESIAYKSSLENRVKNELVGQDLDAVVDRVLDKILPPIVERLVQERLDMLLKEQEKGVESSR